MYVPPASEKLHDLTDINVKSQIKGFPFHDYDIFFLSPLCAQDQNKIAETIIPIANNNKNKLNFAKSDDGSGDINQNKKASR